MSDTLFREHLLGTFPQTCLSLWRKLWSLEQFAKYAAGRARLLACGVHTALVRVVASATALVEHKFTHGAGRVAHIEDVAVHPAARGRGLGTALVALLVRLARTHARCYKAVLCCAPARRAFYEHCGFVPLETEMVCPLLDAPSPPPVLDTEH